MIQDAIRTVADRKDLTSEQAAQAMGEVMRGEATPSQIAAYLTALRMKGESADELAGSLRVMRDNVIRVDTRGRACLDNAGTGGDGAQTFNISTTAALVIAAAGVPVAKHGNRSVSSRCGSADLLESLGVKIQLDPERARKCLEECGFVFLFAPAFHPALKHASPVRREIGIRTIFNLLGPIANPAFPKFQLVGVYSPKVVEPVAQAIRATGIERACVFHHADGLDEVASTGVTHVVEVTQAETLRYDVTPEDAGLTRGVLAGLAGGEPETNRQITMDILSGVKGVGRDTVLLTAALALRTAGAAKDLLEGASRAAEAIDSGKARGLLDRLVEVTNRP